MKKKRRSVIYFLWRYIIIIKEDEDTVLPLGVVKQVQKNRGHVQFTYQTIDHIKVLTYQISEKQRYAPALIKAIQLDWFTISNSSHYTKAGNSNAPRLLGSCYSGASLGGNNPNYTARGIHTCPTVVLTFFLRLRFHVLTHAQQRNHRCWRLVVEIYWVSHLRNKGVIALQVFYMASLNLIAEIICRDVFVFVLWPVFSSLAQLGVFKRSVFRRQINVRFASTEDIHIYILEWNEPKACLPVLHPRTLPWTCAISPIQSSSMNTEHWFSN